MNTQTVSFKPQTRKEIFAQLKAKASQAVIVQEQAISIDTKQEAYEKCKELSKLISTCILAPQKSLTNQEVEFNQEFNTWLSESLETHEVQNLKGIISKHFTDEGKAGVAKLIRTIALKEEIGASWDMVKPELDRLLPQAIEVVQFMRDIKTLRENEAVRSAYLQYCLLGKVFNAEGKDITKEFFIAGSPAEGGAKKMDGKNVNSPFECQALVDLLLVAPVHRHSIADSIGYGFTKIFGGKDSRHFFTETCFKIFSEFIFTSKYDFDKSLIKAITLDGGVVPSIINYEHDKIKIEGLSLAVPEITIGAKKKLITLLSSKVEKIALSDLDTDVAFLTWINQGFTKLAKPEEKKEFLLTLNSCCFIALANTNSYPTYNGSNALQTDSMPLVVSKHAQLFQHLYKKISLFEKIGVKVGEDIALASPESFKGLNYVSLDSWFMTKQQLEKVTIPEVKSFLPNYMGLLQGKINELQSLIYNFNITATNVQFLEWLDLQVRQGVEVWGSFIPQVDRANIISELKNFFEKYELKNYLDIDTSSVKSFANDKKELLSLARKTLEELKLAKEKLRNLEEKVTYYNETEAKRSLSVIFNNTKLVNLDNVNKLFPQGKVIEDTINWFNSTATPFYNQLILNSAKQTELAKITDNDAVTIYEQAKSCVTDVLNICATHFTTFLTLNSACASINNLAASVSSLINSQLLNSPLYKVEHKANHLIGGYAVQFLKLKNVNDQQQALWDNLIDCYLIKQNDPEKYEAIVSRFTNLVADKTQKDQIRDDISQAMDKVANYVYRLEDANLINQYLAGEVLDQERCNKVAELTNKLLKYLSLSNDDISLLLPSIRQILSTSFDDTSSSFSTVKINDELRKQCAELSLDIEEYKIAYAKYERSKSRLALVTELLNAINGVNISFQVKFAAILGDNISNKEELQELIKEKKELEDKLPSLKRLMDLAEGNLQCKIKTHELFKAYSYDEKVARETINLYEEHKTTHKALLKQLTAIDKEGKLIAREGGWFTESLHIVSIESLVKQITQLYSKAEQLSSEEMEKLEVLLKQYKSTIAGLQNDNTRIDAENIIIKTLINSRLSELAKELDKAKQELKNLVGLDDDFTYKDLEKAVNEITTSFSTLRTLFISLDNELEASKSGEQKLRLWNKLCKFYDQGLGSTEDVESLNLEKDEINYLLEIIQVLKPANEPKLKALQDMLVGVVKSKKISILECRELVENSTFQDFLTLNNKLNTLANFEVLSLLYQELKSSGAAEYGFEEIKVVEIIGQETALKLMVVEKVRHYNVLAKQLRDFYNNKDKIDIAYSHFRQLVRQSEKIYECLNDHEFEISTIKKELQFSGSSPTLFEVNPFTGWDGNNPLDLTQINSTNDVKLDNAENPVEESQDAADAKEKVVKEEGLGKAKEIIEQYGKHIYLHLESKVKQLIPYLRKLGASVITTDLSYISEGKLYTHITRPRSSIREIKQLSENGDSVVVGSVYSVADRSIPSVSKPKKVEGLDTNSESQVIEQSLADSMKKTRSDEVTSVESLNTNKVYKDKISQEICKNYVKELDIPIKKKLIELASKEPGYKLKVRMSHIEIADVMARLKKKCDSTNNDTLKKMAVVKEFYKYFDAVKEGGVIDINRDKKNEFKNIKAIVDEMHKLYSGFLINNKTKIDKASDRKKDNYTIYDVISIINKKIISFEGQVTLALQLIELTQSHLSEKDIISLLKDIGTLLNAAFSEWRYLNMLFFDDEQQMKTSEANKTGSAESFITTIDSTFRLRKAEFNESSSKLIDSEINLGKLEGIITKLAAIPEDRIEAISSIASTKLTKSPKMDTILKGESWAEVATVLAETMVQEEAAAPSLKGNKIAEDNHYINLFLAIISDKNLLKLLGITDVRKEFSVSGAKTFVNTVARGVTKNTILEDEGISQQLVATSLQNLFKVIFEKVREDLIQHAYMFNEDVTTLLKDLSYTPEKLDLIKDILSKLRVRDMRSILSYSYLEEKGLSSKDISNNGDFISIIKILCKDCKIQLGTLLLNEDEENKSRLFMEFNSYIRGNELERNPAAVIRFIEDKLKRIIFFRRDDSQLKQISGYLDKLNFLAYFMQPKVESGITIVPSKVLVKDKVDSTLQSKVLELMSKKDGILHKLMLNLGDFSTLKLKDIQEIMAYTFSEYKDYLSLSTFILLEPKLTDPCKYFTRYILNIYVYLSAQYKLNLEQLILNLTEEVNRLNEVWTSRFDVGKTDHNLTNFQQALLIELHNYLVSGLDVCKTYVPEVADQPNKVKNWESFFYHERTKGIFVNAEEALSQFLSSETESLSSIILESINTKANVKMEVEYIEVDPARVNKNRQTAQLLDDFRRLRLYKGGVVTKAIPEVKAKITPTIVRRLTTGNPNPLKKWSGLSRELRDTPGELSKPVKFSSSQSNWV